VEENLDEVDALIKPLLKDPIEKTFPVELSMLRLGTAELLHVIEVPYKVVLTEYIELAKEYGTDEGSSFVNGVLHAVAMKTRQTEIN
jgi:N utilization substance protein B